MAGEPMTPKQLALLLETDARTVRKYLRAKHGKIGQGKRWEITPGSKKELNALTKDFNAWKSTNARPIADKVTASEPEVEAPAEILDIDDELSLDDLEEPSFEDLEDIDDLDLDLD